MKTEKKIVSEEPLSREMLSELEIMMARRCIAELRRAEHGAAAHYLETLLSENPGKLLTQWTPSTP